MQTAPGFPSDGGELGALMRHHDWAASPLGAPQHWPQGLRAVAALMVEARLPMFCAWGEQLTLLYNDAYAEVLGDKHPQAFGAPLAAILAELWNDIAPLIHSALAGQSTYSEKLPLRMRRHGYVESTWFTFSCSPLRDDAGRVAGVFCVGTEVTAQVQMERYRAEEHQRLVSLFEQAPGIIAMVRGPKHLFETANKSFRQLLGCGDVIGRPARQALPEVEGQGFFELLEHVYGSGEPFVGRAVPLRVKRPPGAPEEVRFLDFIFQPILDADGGVAGVFLEGYDVTLGKIVEDELRAANRQKDQFLAMLAHELRNPLAPITSAAQLLRLGKLNAAGVRHASDVIARQAEHMTDLVNDLLDVSRVTRGLVTLEQELLDVRAVVSAAVEQVRPLIDAKAHVLQVEVPTLPLAVQGDHTRLVQVVSNMLNNAAKYTPSGGQIALQVSAGGQTVSISVADNGIGIGADVLPYIFDLFTQAEPTPDRSQGGLGIGLALVKSLAVLHGGSVEARSAGAQCGSTFELSLPRVALQPDAHAEVVRAGAADPAQPLRVMVVDDNQDAAAMLASLLEVQGHAVSVDHDGRSALRRAALERPQVMLLDIGLPDTDGYALARQLRSLPELGSVILVALTGYGQLADRERAEQAGFDHHLVKPADLAQVGAILATVVRVPGSERL